MFKQPRAVLLWSIIAIAIITIISFGFPKTIEIKQVEETIEQPVDVATKIRLFLESKQSPLASDAEYIAKLKHWKLLIAISAIESQYCKRQLGYNCWGIGGDSAYRYYSSFRAAAQDANDLIENWQSKGRWLTVEDMNGSYVVPYSENWERVVKQVLKQLDEL
jgi:hypothetical protein